MAVYRSRTAQLTVIVTQARKGTIDQDRDKGYTLRPSSVRRGAYHRTAEQPYLSSTDTMVHCC